MSDRMEDAISEVLDGRIVTRWVLVAEAIEDDGEPSVHSLTSPGLPLWQRFGLLQWDAQSWVPQPLWSHNPEDDE